MKTYNKSREIKEILSLIIYFLIDNHQQKLSLISCFHSARPIRLRGLAFALGQQCYFYFLTVKVKHCPNKTFYPILCAVCVCKALIVTRVGAREELMEGMHVEILENPACLLVYTSIDIWIGINVFF